MRYLILSILSFLSTLGYSQVQEYHLSNGLKILVKEDHRASIVVSMVWYKVGSADENYGTTGVAHALEHMMFKGTPQYPQGVFSKSIAEIGGQENAFTNYDYTAYYEKIAANQLPLVFKLEADRMNQLILSESAFNQEIKVIREERRLRTEDNPQALAFEQHFASAFLSLPYHHPVIGWMHDLYQLNINDLRQWYEHYYTPNNATLVVVGDVSASKVRDLAEQYFGPLKAKPLIFKKEQQEPPVLGQRLLEINGSVQLPVLVMSYLVPSIKTAKVTWEPYTLELISGILSANQGARFFKNLVYKQQLATEATAMYDPYMRYSTQFIIYATPQGPHNLSELKAGILKEIARLKTEPISITELNRIKTQLIAQKTFDKDSVFEQAMELGIATTLDLKLQLLDDYPLKINAISPAQIQAVANKYFHYLTETRLTPLSKP